MVTMTTEHYTLGMARSQTTAEANGRASIFLAAVASGLVALGFLGPSGPTFVIFALILFPTLAFLDFVTFHRVLQNSIEDLGYAYRLDLCRRFYAEAWPMLAPYLYRPRFAEDVRDPARRLGRRPWSWQLLLTVPGVVAVVTGVLLGVFAAVLSRSLAGSSISVAVAVGAVAATLAILGLHHRQRQAFGRADYGRIDAQMHTVDGG